MNMDQALVIAKNKMMPHRFQHCLGVARTAKKLADHYGADGEKAYLAGILHDYARDMPGKELLAAAFAGGVIMDDVYRQVPELLHGPVAAILLKNCQQVEDPAVLAAIKHHTLGEVGMGVLEKILYIADMIEPGRDYPGVEFLRSVACTDLDQALVCALDATIRYCLERSLMLHPKTIEVRNYYLPMVRDINEPIS